MKRLLQVMSLSAHQPLRRAALAIAMCAALTSGLAAAGPTRAAGLPEYVSPPPPYGYVPFVPPQILPPLPDLVITRAGTIPEYNPRDGGHWDSSVVWATVQNIGNAPAAATQTDLKIVVGAWIASFDYLLPTPALGVGQSATVQITLPGALTPCSDEFDFAANAGHTLWESNYNNDGYYIPWNAAGCL